MKITCNVINDLLPLYTENISSDDTRELVEEHIISCESCKLELDKLNTPKGLSLDYNVLPLKKMKIALLKRKYLTILLSVSLTILVLIIAMGYITAQEYIPYSEKPITIAEAANSSVIVHFEVPNTKYEIMKYRSEDNSEYIYNISTWTSKWSRITNKDSSSDFILNPNGETVTSVYYSSNDGTEDILIYGKDQYPNGGIITLPRLFLSYYATIAALIAILLGIVLFIFRNHKHAKTIIFKFFALPIAYLIATICIKGLTFTSYSASRDFFTILLTMLPIYCIILIAEKLFVNRLKNKDKKSF